LEIEREVKDYGEWKFLALKAAKDKGFLAVWKLGKLQGVIWKTTGV